MKHLTLLLLLMGCGGTSMAVSALDAGPLDAQPDVVTLVDSGPDALAIDPCTCAWFACVETWVEMNLAHGQCRDLVCRGFTRTVCNDIDGGL